MKKYEYKVDYINSNVSASEVSNGSAGNKVAKQVEQKITQHMQEGFELYQQFDSSVKVKQGCLAGLIGRSSEYITITTTVFRKEIG